MPNSLVPPGIAYLADNIISRHNIMGSSPEDRARWASGLSFAADADTIFFAGCGYQYSAQLENLMAIVRKLDGSAIGSDAAMRLGRFQKKLGLGGVVTRLAGGGGDSSGGPLRDAVRVLQHLGLKMGYLGTDEPCCGALLYFSGMHKEFADNSRQAFDTFKSRGVKNIIGIVPSCTYALRDLMPKFVDGYDIRVRHFSEAVVESLDQKQLSLPEKIKVTYHDPCQMSRYLEITRQPRQVLAAIKNVELVEPDFTSGSMSTCCGGGGGFEAVFPELSQTLATNRARELASTGAQTIVTQCPGCIMQIKAGLKKLDKNTIKVLDLATILAQALGL